MYKVLFVASTENHLKTFHSPYLKYFKEKGYEVSTAANGENAIPCVDKHYNIDFARSPYSSKNVACYRKLKELIYNNRYDIIHCHTPAASVLTRLAARKARKKGAIVIYTAHGFHFFHGAPKSSVIFRLVEKRLSKITDHLITINTEDYESLQFYRFKSGAAYKVNGVGVDASRFMVQTPDRKASVRQDNDIPEDAFVLIFAAEYSNRKNQGMLIETVNKLKDKLPEILLLLPGEGANRADYTRRIKELGLERHIRLLGLRDDMDNLLQAADIAVSSSKQEGLPINVVEAMAVGLPVVATKIRGHVDLIQDGKNGFLVPLNDTQKMAEKVMHLYEYPDKRAACGKQSLELVKPFLLEQAINETIQIYEQIEKTLSFRSSPQLSDTVLR